MRRILSAALLVAVCHGQETDPEVIMEALALQVDSFEECKLFGDGKAASFEIKLGEKPAKLEDAVFDGFRFRCPELPEGADFIWYFNAPANWGNWYIFPVEGKPEQAFRNWLDADKLYEKLDQHGSEGRLRILQTLDGSYFKPGKDYIMWFRRTGEGEGKPLQGIAAFAKGEDSWDHDDIEKALKLKPAPAAEQVALLKSRGGEILLNENFFDPGYAKGRIDSAFDSIRSTKRMRGGFFMTMHISVPSCTTEPSLKEIIAKHGRPDFSRKGEELVTARKKAGGDPPDEDDAKITTHYYDHFGFEVETGDAEPKVLRVTTTGANFHDLKGAEKGSSYGQIDIENLTVFHKDGAEVGRAYYFLEGGKTPIFIKEPPPGEYQLDENFLIAKGKGEWVWEKRFDDGKVASRIPLKANQLHGKAEGFYENGEPRFKAEYRKGELDGELLQYNEAGKEVGRRKFKGGKEEGSEEDGEE